MITRAPPMPGIPALAAEREPEDHDRHVRHRRGQVRLQLVAVRGEQQGPVSPVMRASASRTPVMMPLRAARYATCTVTFHLGTPSDAAASRSWPGLGSASSVGRTTTGRAMTAKGDRSGPGREMPEGHDHQLYTNRPNIEGASSRMSSTKRMIWPSVLPRDTRPDTCRRSCRSGCRWRRQPADDGSCRRTR